MMNNTSSLNNSGSLPFGIWLVVPVEAAAIAVVVVCIIFLYFYHKALRKKIDTALSKTVGKMKARTEAAIIKTTGGRKQVGISSMSEYSKDDYQVSLQRTPLPLIVSQEEADNTECKSLDQVESQTVHTGPINEDPYRTLDCSNFVE